MIDKKGFPIPILLIVFNRLDTTKKVLERLKKLRPDRLYIASDGPRENKQGEEEKVIAVRKYLEEFVDWDCKILTNYQEKNLGCKYNPQSAISWFFDHEPYGIILEDDCVASESFFTYCQELLHRYVDDLRIWGITGANPLQKFTKKSTSSYYFSEYVQTWGWATWANRWNRHLEMMEDFDIHLNEYNVNNKLSNRVANEAIIKCARISHNDQLDTWDYQWFFSAFANNGLFTVPKVNLIGNIGMGEEATHTINRKDLYYRPGELEFPLVHPVNILPSKELDNRFYQDHYNWKSFWNKVTDPRHYIKVMRSRLKI